MFSIVLGCAYNFRHHLKAALRNKNKTVINFVAISCKDSVIVSVRNVMSMTEEEDNDRQNIENKYIKLDMLNENEEKYKLAKKKGIVDTINHINSIDYVKDSNHILLLLKSCINVADCLPEEKVKLGESLWTVLDVCNFKIDTVHYNTLLTLYVKNEYNFSPLQLLKIMRDNNIYANSSTYKKCIKYYCMKGDIKKALELLKDMERLRLPIPKTIFNSILFGYSAFGEIKNITKTLAIMKEKKLDLTTETYTAVMCAYAKIDNINEIRNILRTCISQNIYFTNRDILNVIYVLAKNNHTTEIDTMYQYLNKKKRILYYEIQVILKLLSINQTHIAISALSYMSLNNDHPQCEDVLKLILRHMINMKWLLSDIVHACITFKCKEIFKKSLLILVYYSLMKNDSSTLRLLKLCKCYYVIKPHYFWPLLVSHGRKYNLKGILDILEIMINDFNVQPTVDTIADYVLPFTFGDVHYVRNLLIKYKINEIIINNAYVLMLLRKVKIKEAALYVRNFHSKYFYKILARDLRHCAVFTNDVQNFLYISYNLLEDANLWLTLEANNESCNVTFVPIVKQLHESIIDFQHHKSWLRKLMYETAKQKIKLGLETTETINELLYKNRTHNVMSSA